MAREHWQGLPLVMRVFAILAIGAVLFGTFWLRVALVNPNLSRAELAIAAFLSLFAATAIVIYFDRR
jgi:uncharacterized membrane protein YciS (DUF1049 family)